MRAGITGFGIVIIVLGFILVLFFWPLIGFETSETFSMDDAKEESSVKYVGQITDINEFAGFYRLELDNGNLAVYTDSENFELHDKVFVTIEFGSNLTNWDENTYLVKKVPTLEGAAGSLFIVTGLFFAIAGARLKKPSIEEILEFNIQPPIQSPNTNDIKTEQVTCPKCGKIFGVSGDERPLKIVCPDCGVEGIVK
jgi:DNA-directed RNA polymerase subunit RPC12/RpoP